jgi:prophage maintenance system killer protein
MAELLTMLNPVIEEKQHREFCGLVAAQFKEGTIKTLQDHFGTTTVFGVCSLNEDVQTFLLLTDIEPNNHDYLGLVKLNETARSLFEEDGTYGVKFGDQLRSMVYRSTYPPMGADKPMTIIERAAFYWFEIATHQAFHNGNKRTAFLAALSYLDMNGYNFDSATLTEAKLYQITLKISRGEMALVDIERLLYRSTSIRMHEMRTMED